MYRILNGGVMKLDNGIHDITNEEYHDSEGYSRSALACLRQSPYHFWYKYLSGEYQQEQTDAMVFGSALHTWCLEPNLFDEQFLVMPNCDRRTKGGKEIYADCMERKGERDILTIDQFQKLELMGARVRKEGSFSDQIITDADIEKSIFFTHDETGLKFKVRPDVWKGSLVADLKSTKDASYRAFQGSAYGMSYYLQAGMISEALKTIGIDMTTFVFIAIEKEPPYSMGVYVLDPEAIEFGINQFHALARQLKDCLDRNEFEDYGVKIMGIPQYARYEVIE
jgi:hypothetical protein